MVCEYFRRILPHDISIRGYHVPAGTFLIWSAHILGMDPKYFPDAEVTSDPLESRNELILSSLQVYRPERWLVEDRKAIHPFSVLQFSHGPRKCIGKRFAELEMQLLICKLVSNFRIEWASDRKVECEWKLLNQPDAPLKFKFVDI